MYTVWHDYIQWLSLPVFYGETFEHILLIIIIIILLSDWTLTPPPSLSSPWYSLIYLHDFYFIRFQVYVKYSLFHLFKYS